jgi:hypothetical protein
LDSHSSVTHGSFAQEPPTTATTDHRRRLLCEFIFGQQSRSLVTHDRFRQQLKTIATTDHRRRLRFNLFPIWTRIRRLLTEDLRTSCQQQLPQIIVIGYSSIYSRFGIALVGYSQKICGIKTTFTTTDHRRRLLFLLRLIFKKFPSYSQSHCDCFRISPRQPLFHSSDKTSEFYRVRSSKTTSNV